jgi:hypothetical protein
MSAERVRILELLAECAADMKALDSALQLKLLASGWGEVDRDQRAEESK